MRSFAGNSKDSKKDQLSPTQAFGPQGRPSWTRQSVTVVVWGSGDQQGVIWGWQGVAVATPELARMSNVGCFSSAVWKRQLCNTQLAREIWQQGTCCSILSLQLEADNVCRVACLL
ncbi:hypothetical protein J6590_047815 [Homalodisca vitripennis]|nr:hypothetical protein J6590_047815 [Homalodisca vitripennis]